MQKIQTHEIIDFMQISNESMKLVSLWWHPNHTKNITKDMGENVAANYKSKLGFIVCLVAYM
jgi:hypothetical protein